MIELGMVDIRNEDDVVKAHQTARTLAAQLGYSTFEQTRLATAMSEIARNALTYAGGGSVTLGLDDGHTSFDMVVSDRGPGIAELDAILSGQRKSPTGLGVGISGARKLVDAFAIETTQAGTRVEMQKRLPRRTGQVEPARLSSMRSQLAGQLADDPGQEIRRLFHDVAERDRRIAELTEELHETNRGVMALHTELEVRAEYQRQAVELRSRLLSEMGHEIRTPLHSITSIAQFLLDRLDGELTAEQEKQVGIIHEIAETLTAYVNDLLDLARTDAGKAKVHVTQFSAERTLRTLRRMVHPLARPQVRLLLDCEPDLPALETDEAKVQQILRNLAANALKFTERGEVRVAAGRSASGGDDRIAFLVNDTGVGIASEDFELVFSEFAQVDGRADARMRGSGLGLPLSRRLAELLGGTLTLQSEPGRGSAFKLDIPRVYRGESTQPPRVQSVEPIKTAPRTQEPRVLVIDDDLGSRYVLRRWLGERYRVDEAASGSAGLALAREQRPDVIFLDVIIPDLTGFDILDSLKAAPQTRDIPVIVYTALVLGRNDRERLAAACAILRKSTASRVADRFAIEEALVRAGVALALEPRP